ncbi:MAG: S8 family serine peptidase, partial [Lentimicrobium sp.]|nr:S8 family serine peptidase [Lentimicrobium sp.]
MKNLINIVFVQLLFLITQVAYSQTYDDFYYSHNGKEYLNIVQNQYVVEFINGVDEDIFLQNNIEFEKLSQNNYKVGANISFIQNNLSLVHFNPVYKRIRYGTDSFIKNEIILKFNENIQESSKDSIITNYGLIETKATSLYNQYRVTNPLQVSKAVYETGLVKFCIPAFFGSHPMRFDGYIPNDQYFNKQFYLRNTGQELNGGVYGTAGADIKATKAWEITKGSENIVIAIIDDGVTDDHIDLPTNNQIRLLGSNIFHEWDPYNDDPDDPSPVWVVNDPQNVILEYHGHMVTGVAVASQDNEEGISGVAPNCKAMIVRVIFEKRDDVKHPDEIYGQAINFAYENGANVIIMAWGWSPQQPCEAESVIIEAIETAINGGCIVVNAAGNFHPEKSLDVSFPASAGIEGLIVVGASDQDDIKANYSFTSEHINVVAPAGALQVWTMDFPGGNGFNPWPFGDGTTIPPYGEVLPNLGDYKLDFTGRFSGTSAATPQVAGCAALALSVNPNLSVKQINNLVKHTADRVGPYNYGWSESMGKHSKELGYGRLNCYRMVKTAKDMQVPGVDLYIRDLEDDFGIEPNEAETGTPMWISPDIWIRNQDDGTVNQVHENPEYSATNPVYVYIRVTNKGDETSTGNEELHLYWAKAGTDLVWKDYWDGSVSVNGIPMGGILGDQNVPIINP